MRFRRYKKAYQEGRRAFKDGIPWAENPYDSGTMKWVSWNDGKHDAMEDCTTKQSKNYYNKIRERQGITDHENYLL